MVSEGPRGTTRVSLRGKVSGFMLFSVSKLVAKIVAPNFDTMEGLLRAVQKNRANGTALPGPAVRARFSIADEERPNGRIFRLVRKRASTAGLHLMYIHGGAAVMDMQGIQYRLVNGLLDLYDADMTMSIYPLAPENTWTETLRFNLDLFDELAAEYGADKVAVVGDSAGGTIAMLMAQALRDQSRSLPAGLLLFSPALDLSASGADQPELEKRDSSITIALIRNMATLWGGGLNGRDPRISPLFADQTGLPPIMLFTGDREILESDALRLVEANPDVDHRSYAEMGHVFPIGGGREGKHALAASAAFLSRLGPR